MHTQPSLPRYALMPFRYRLRLPGYMQALALGSFSLPEQQDREALRPLSPLTGYGSNAGSYKPRYPETTEQRHAPPERDSKAVQNVNKGMPNSPTPAKQGLYTGALNIAKEVHLEPYHALQSVNHNTVNPLPISKDYVAMRIAAAPALPQAYYATQQAHFTLSQRADAATKQAMEHGKVAQTAINELMPSLPRYAMPLGMYAPAWQLPRYALGAIAYHKTINNFLQPIANVLTMPVHFWANAFAPTPAWQSETNNAPPIAFPQVYNTYSHTPSGQVNPPAPQITTYPVVNPTPPTTASDYPPHHLQAWVEEAMLHVLQSITGRL